MQTYLEKYKKVVRELIKKDFPVLRNKKIIIKEKKAKWRGHVNYYPWGMSLYLSTKLRRFPEKSVRRIIFHELCHLELFAKEGWMKTEILYLFYLFSSKTRKKVEAEANILMIKRGHWKEVVTARNGNLKRGLSYSLSLEEIKYYKDKFKK